MIDKRVIERQIRNGTLNAADYQRTLEALPDMSDRISRELPREPAPAAPPPPAAAAPVAAPVESAPRTEPEPPSTESAAL